jgi:hypothetical protein
MKFFRSILPGPLLGSAYMRVYGGCFGKNGVEQNEAQFFIGANDSFYISQFQTRSIVYNHKIHFIYLIS